MTYGTARPMLAADLLAQLGGVRSEDTREMTISGLPVIADQRCPPGTVYLVSSGTGQYVALTGMTLEGK